jgi:hypothetical protein
MNDYNEVVSDNQEDEMDELDTSWITNFDNNDKEYKLYYCVAIEFINFQFIYINANNEIEKLKVEKILLKDAGKIQKEYLISIIKHNQIHNNIKYYLLSILIFNITIEPMNLKTFLQSKDTSIGNNFLTVVSNIDTLKFNKSISMFHDLNSIIVILKKKHNRQTNNTSKKVFKGCYIHNKTKKTT